MGKYLTGCHCVTCTIGKINIASVVVEIIIKGKVHNFPVTFLVAGIIFN